MTPKGLWIIMPAISWQEFIFVVHYSILVEEGRWDKDAFCGQDRNKTKCGLWSPRCLKRSLFAGLSSRRWYWCVAQSCDNIIHLFNRYGTQPFPRRKRTSWNVSLSPMGFFQNFNCMSMGHHFKGKMHSHWCLWIFIATYALKHAQLHNAKYTF